MKKRKICIFTGTRAEYGLLKPLIDELKTKDSIELQLIVSGMHLSPEFGLTFKEIDSIGISKVEKVEILLSSDTPIGISKAMGLGMISYSETLVRLQPDLLIGLGDRFELFSIVSAALVLKIPVAHIHGGEITFGAYDDLFRHSITKMSHLHFTSTEEYRQRVIQLGENPKTVFNVGALGLDNIKNLKLLSKNKLEELIEFKLDKPYFMVTYHPVTLEKNNSVKHFNELLNALQLFTDHKIIITKANADNEGRAINKLIDEYTEQNKDKVKSFYALGQLKYLSALKFADIIIGNSSSGIIEVPFFKKPTINIGDRQKGRILTDSIVQCKPKKNDIETAIKKALSKDFQKKFRNIENIYGSGTTAKNITNIIISAKFNDIIKKEFYDLPTPF